MSNTTQTYQCPNTDCDNCELYTDDDLNNPLPANKRCPQCMTVIEEFLYVAEEEQDEPEDDDDDDDFDDITIDDFGIEDLQD